MKKIWLIKGQYCEPYAMPYYWIVGAWNCEKQAIETCRILNELIAHIDSWPSSDLTYKISSYKADLHSLSMIDPQADKNQLAEKYAVISTDLF